MKIEDIEYGGPGIVESVTDPETGETFSMDPQEQNPGGEGEQLPNPQEPANPPAPVDPEPPSNQPPSLESAPTDPVGSVVDTYDTLIQEQASMLQEVLEQYGYEGGVAALNGELVKIEDLTPEEQGKFLKHVIEAEKEKASVSNPELKKLDTYLKKTGKTAEEFIAGIVEDQKQQTPEEAAVSIAHLDADEVFKLKLITEIPGISDAELQERLLDAKKYSSFGTEVDAIRQQFLQQEALKAQQEQQDALNAQAEAREEEIKYLVQSVENIEEIDGIPLKKDVKNYLLHQIVHPTKETGKPAFINRLQNDPTTLFKLAYYDVYGESIQQAQEAKLRQAFEAGRESALKRNVRYNIVPSPQEQPRKQVTPTPAPSKPSGPIEDPEAFWDNYYTNKNKS